MQVFRDLGVTIEDDGDEVRIHGVGRWSQGSSKQIDIKSGTSIRLIRCARWSRLTDVWG